MSLFTFDHAHNNNISLSTVLTTTLLAGVVSLGVWEIWSKVLAPFYMGGALTPVGLVKSSLGIGKETFGAIGAASANAVGNAVANGIHLVTGLVAFPLGYMVGARPISNAVLPNLPWWATGAAYGVALYIFAMYIMAHLFAGFPPFFGFNALSQASLIGHVALGVSIAGVVEKRSEG
ncbi:MAG: hypothetical protein ABJK39_09030 [Hyphomicrobiales bacterium]